MTLEHGFDEIDSSRAESSLIARRVRATTFIVDEETAQHSPDASFLSLAGFALVMRQDSSSSWQLGTLAALMPRLSRIPT